MSRRLGRRGWRTSSFSHLRWKYLETLPKLRSWLLRGLEHSQRAMLLALKEGYPIHTTHSLKYFSTASEVRPDCWRSISTGRPTLCTSLLIGSSAETDAPSLRDFGQP